MNTDKNMNVNKEMEDDNKSTFGQQSDVIVDIGVATDVDINANMDVIFNINEKNLH